jgi:hypothetical protein
MNNQKRAIFFVVILFISLILLEVGARIVFSFIVGPQVMLYGTSYCCGPDIGVAVRGESNPKNLEAGRAPGGVRFHQNEQAGYSKYFPNENRKDHDPNDVPFEVTINSHGFRGKEYTVAPKPNTLRVVTLGASSTFGYRNRDHDTYPYQLENTLNDRLKIFGCGDRTAFEVINLGIPHTTSEQNVALYLAEGRPLKPDVVTFYEGVNDTNIGMDTLRWESLPFYRRVIRYYRNDIIIFGLMESIFLNMIAQFSRSDLDWLLEGKPHTFLTNIDAIRLAVESDSGMFFVASQQAKSLMIPSELMRGVTYSDEEKAVREKLKSTGQVTAQELWFLVHTALMKQLRQWAQENGHLFIDVIAAMDDRRDFLVSWVHLSPEGNRLVSRTFSDAIFEAACGIQ